MRQVNAGPQLLASVAIADACVAAMGGVAEFPDKTVELDDEQERRSRLLLPNDCASELT